MPDLEPRRRHGSPPDDEGEVPLFGTWPRIHAAVVAAALAVMGLLALFSRWPF
jgi:hypothetical protein